MYIFSKDKREIHESKLYRTTRIISYLKTNWGEIVIDNTNSGGVTVNDVILHAGFSGAPFGGVGSSGFGYYHGPYGFNGFTHLRTVMNSPSWLERALTFRYPPFTATEIPKNLKLKAKFKRGESIQDQRRKSSSITRNGLRVAASVAIFGTLYYYYYFNN